MKSSIEPIPNSIRDYAEDPRIASEYDDFHRLTDLLTFDTHILNQFFTEPGLLIDLGCGTGRHVVHFARRGFDVTGVDLSRHMIKLTQDKLAQASLKATLYQSDICNLSFLPENSFRYGICMFSTIGLIQGRVNRLNFLRGVNRIIEPGGFVAVHAHNIFYNLTDISGRQWFFQNLRDALRGRVELGDKDMDGYRGIRDMYLHVFRLGELKKLLRKSGLRIKKVVFINAPRNAPLKGTFFKSLRSNGFILIAQKK